LPKTELGVRSRCHDAQNYAVSSATPAARLSGLRGYLVRAVVVLVSVVLGLAVAEVLLRCFHYRAQLSHDWLLTAKTTGASPRVANDDLIVINPKFLQGGYYGLSRPGAKTIVALGDSFVAGYPGPYYESYPSVLESLLEKRGAKADVLNLGLGDSGPDQQLRLFEQYLLPRRTPDTVVWAFYANDISDNVSLAAYTLDPSGLVPLRGERHWITLRQKIFRAIPLSSRFKLNSFLIRLLLKAPESRILSEMPEAYRKDPDSYGLKKIELELQAMERLATAKGFRVYYVLIAPQALYLARTAASWNTSPQVVAYHKLEALFREHSALSAYFEDATADQIFANAPADRNALGDRHFNANGYRRLAELVATRLSSR
jgi:lysophospholipase L1-like esterase